MASHLPSFDQDDQDFDWDAAVREIDVACQSTSTSTSAVATSNTATIFATPPQPPQLDHIANNWNHRLNKPHNNSRQLTLDKFISNGKPCVGIDQQGDQIRVPEIASLLPIDPLAAQTWIYPDNVPRRDYQLSISETALFSNTLVVLPTGLGKTLIAAVVMYNYFRWFPEGKIVFAAPSRPLVMQQIEACHNIVGIPQVSCHVIMLVASCTDY
ncbi:hypothetical protein KSS87_022932 [Heliosperma pusillum]|nr:hypothetical protein KSS87_022932 [Heliosperma pusillum]